VGQGVSCNGEIRFVTAIVSATAVQVNAPFSSAPAAGTEIAPSISYFPATELPSVSIFDYWDPSTALQRILCGAAVRPDDGEGERRFSSVRVRREWRKT
jgi:hypothetical protein